MGRAPCCEKIGLKKGPWTPEEDQKLVSYISQHGHGSWRALPKRAGLLRCGKSCRLRWTNYLRPDIKRGKFSLSEEQTIIQLHALLGNRWSAIASHLPKRTDNEIKNYWNTHLKKRLVTMGIDPATHKPKSDTTSGGHMDANSDGSSAINHMAQWESARLEAEARLTREAKMRAKGSWASSAVVSPNTPPSVKPWQTRATDLSSTKPDHGNPSSKASFNAVEVMNTLQNWEKSLQEQTGLALFDHSWKPSAVGEGHDSSCCSSPNSDRMDQGSPTSTLCSLEAHPKCAAAAQYVSTEDSGALLEMRKLPWTDDSVSKDMQASLACRSDAFAGLDCVKSYFSPKVCHLDSSLQGESFPAVQPFQDIVFAASGDATIASSSLNSSTWSQSSDDNLSMRLSKKNLQSIPSSVASAMNFLGEAGLLSQDITSNKGSLSSIGCGEITSEYLMDLPKLNRETFSGSAREYPYNALMSEEYQDYLLKQLVDSPKQHDGALVAPFHTGRQNQNTCHFTTWELPCNALEFPSRPPENYTGSAETIQLNP